MEGFVNDTAHAVGDREQRDEKVEHSDDFCDKIKLHQTATHELINSALLPVRPLLGTMSVLVSSSHTSSQACPRFLLTCFTADFPRRVRK